MTVEATPCLGFSLPEASPLSADGFPHDVPAGGCSLLFPVIIACICIYIVPPEFRVHMILESRPDWLLHGCLGTLQGIGGRWAGPGLVLTGRPCGEGIERLCPPASHEAGGGPVAGPGPLHPLLTQCSPGSSPQGWVVCLQGSLGRRLGERLCPQALPEALGKRTCQALPSQELGHPGPTDVLHAGAFSAKRLLLQELSAEALDLACPLT